ncbi:uncharacterized protein LACBIDRAFT_296061 [Laccaria bicolor S238N-H82]|uniref:Predicted protein n=1 Tax=Laccaria bicolor (strain S238N-H82 / ATCC MYA-4686) TaxID=486041 RepID=B0E3E6_LACBS|nr:uncharacterized protein LACBIDRAFT_296061 [Laccaria bicolor S238N-H82]EDQ98634.1 predicted protein [Laccaria bicolor S238N-H82]|eukprot:XP_001890714.1 predicted protein [Laccaria bicolor S238N-H82]
MATTTSLTQPPSPTTPHHRPPSRSERLLRDTLKRDEQERLPTHRRRHSVNVSPHPQGGEDNYAARGTYLFRTAMNAPRVPSPSPSRHTFNHTLSHYYGSPEHQQRGAQPRSPSPSPSSGRRNRSSHPSPLLPSHGHGMSRQASISQPGRPREGKHRPPAVLVPSPRPGEPMGMTPHEQVLRARLERVLCSAGRVVSDQSVQTTKGERERERRRRSNEVRDEVDGWPWREREYDSPSLVSTPPHSTSSGSSSSNIPNQTREHVQFETRVNVTRNRSKTDPHPVHAPPSTTASSRRNATAPTPPRPHHQQVTTPSHRSKYSQSRERERDEDARLLTPPPTPPFSSSFQFQEQEYHPSPYPVKTRLTPRRPTHAPVPVPVSRGEGDDTCSTSSSSSLHSLPPYGYSPSPPQGQAGSVGGSPQFNARKASARCRKIEGGFPILLLSWYIRAYIPSREIVSLSFIIWPIGT